MVGVAADEPLSAVLPVLAAWRRRGQRQSVVDRWRYRVSWQPVTGLGRRRGAGAGGGCWWFRRAWPTGDLAAACQRALADGGAQVVTVTVDGAAGQDRGMLAGTLRAVASAPGGGRGGVAAGAGRGGAGLSRGGGGDAGAGTGAGRCRDRRPAVGGDVRARWRLTGGPVRVSAAQAMVWGLGRVAALEFPARWGGLADVPAVVTGRVAGWLRGVLAGGTGEDQVAIRGGGVLARRLVRAPAGQRMAGGRQARCWSPAGPGRWAGTWPGGWSAAARRGWYLPRAAASARMVLLDWRPGSPGRAVR